MNIEQTIIAIGVEAESCQMEAQRQRGVQADLEQQAQTARDLAMQNLGAAIKLREVAQALRAELAQDEQAIAAQQQAEFDALGDAAPKG